MSNGQSYIDYLRQLKYEKKQIICDWKNQKLISNQFSQNLFSNQKKYSTIMKKEDICSIDDNYLYMIKIINNNINDNYDCRPRDNIIIIDDDNNINDRQLLNKKQNLISCKLNKK
jgi:hypothetical protein